MKRELSETYYTASQVKARLGINDSTLYNYVRNGDLQHITPPGRKKQGYYLRSEVERLARELDAFFATRRKQASIFTVATEDDIPTCVEITKANLGNVVPDASSGLWYVVRTGNEIVGCVLVFPRDREKMKRVLRKLEKLTIEGPEN